MIADRDASFESKHVVDGGMVDAVKSSDNEACQKSTTYRKIVLYVLMAASKNFVAVKQPYEFFNGIGPNLFSSLPLPLFFCGRRAFSSSPPPKGGGQPTSDSFEDFVSSELKFHKGHEA